MELKQPALGVVCLCLAMTLSFLIIASFSAATFGTWVTFCAVTCVPVQIVLGLVLRCEYPPFVRNLAQPAKGITLVAIMLATAAPISLLAFYVAGSGIAPPTPITLVYVIFAVVVTFWFAVIWGVWPVSSWTKNPSVIALSVLLVTYVLGRVIFHAFFNFAFLSGAPVYVAALDPAGTFDANDALSFAVTTTTVLFVCLLFDFWPITKFARLRAQPFLGLASTIYILCVTALFWSIGVHLANGDSVRFMVNGAIGILFGALVIIVTCEGRLFEERTQPARGLCRLAVAAVLAFLLPLIYRSLMPFVSGNLPGGPQAGYQAENWLVAALLAITFPMMVILADFFQFWPLRRAKRARGE